MIKYLFIFCIISLSYSCKTTKNQLSQLSPVESETQEVETEEIERADEYETTVPDIITTEVIGNCSEDWNSRDRLILYKNDKRIKRLDDAIDGNIFVITQVNKDGYVIKTKIDERNTTVKKDIWLNMALEIVDEYQFEPDNNAPKIDCGTVKFILTSQY